MTATRVSVLPKIVAVLTFLQGVCSYPSIDEKDSSCRFNGSTYHIGEVWHPVVQPFNGRSCVNCTCLQGAMIRCVSAKCPLAVCDDPKIEEGHCCPVCPEKKKQLPIKATPRQRKLRRLDECHKNNKIYRNGEIVLSQNLDISPKLTESQELLKSDYFSQSGFERPQQTTKIISGFKEKDQLHRCSICICQDGEVICRRQLCPKLSCSNPTHNHDECCPQCPESDQQGHITELMTLDGIDVQKVLDNKNEITSCQGGGKEYLNGSEWHPVISPYGRIDCVKCSCMDGIVHCERAQCPNISCDQTRIIPGHCCPICIIEQDPPTSSSESPITESTPEGVKGRPCLAPSTDCFVYQAMSLHFYTLAFESLHKKSVHLLIWKIRDGMIEKYEEVTVSKEQMRSITESQFTRYSLIGSIRTGKLVKFQQRISDLMSRCLSRKRNCHWEMLLRRMRKLRLRKLRNDVMC